LKLLNPPDYLMAAIRTSTALLKNWLIPRIPGTPPGRIN
jgi:hypothetical protein